MLILRKKFPFKIIYSLLYKEIFLIDYSFYLGYLSGIFWKNTKLYDFCLFFFKKHCQLGLITFVCDFITNDFEYN